MTKQKSFPLFIHRAFARVAPLLPRLRRRTLPVVLAGAAVCLLTTPVRAGLISTMIEGDPNAPFSYNLTVEFQNGNYYNFILRLAQPTMTGYDFINTVASLTPGMTVDQTYYASFDAYVLNGIKIGGDANSGFTNGAYWSYWDGTATDPVQWSSDQTGESGRVITPGQADGWVYSDGSAPPQAAMFAVPEPGTWTLLGLSGLGLAVVHRRRPARPGASRVLV